MLVPVLPFMPCPVCPKCREGVRASRRYMPDLDVLAFSCDCGFRFATKAGDAPRATSTDRHPQTIELLDDDGDEPADDDSDDDGESEVG